MKRHFYNAEKYNFVDIIKNLFVCEDLQLLHKKLPKEINYTELHKIGEDNKTWYHKKFYEPINEGISEFQILYDKFIFEVVSKLVDESSFLYQKTPTFRVHAPGNVAVGGWHKDSDYNHPPNEENFIVSLTPAYGTNTVWSESTPGLKDFSPFIMDIGDMIQFDGNRCLHGNKTNDTGYTRVSFDFRIIPFSLYKENKSLKSISASRQFILGDYYSLCEARNV
jgi:hypothetical protein